MDTNTAEFSNAPLSTQAAPMKSRRIFSVGGLAFAGLFGGPLPMGYLIYRDLKTLGLSERSRICIAWFLPLAALWIYVSFIVPPDFISQLIPYFPQTILWWMVARHLLASVHSGYRREGGQFRSGWAAVWFACVAYVALRITLHFGRAVFLWLT